MPELYTLLKTHAAAFPIALMSEKYLCIAVYTRDISRLGCAPRLVLNDTSLIIKNTLLTENK